MRKVPELKDLFKSEYEPKNQSYERQMFTRESQDDGHLSINQSMFLEH